MAVRCTCKNLPLLASVIIRMSLVFAGAAALDKGSVMSSSFFKNIWMYVLVQTISRFLAVVSRVTFEYNMREAFPENEKTAYSLQVRSTNDRIYIPNPIVLYVHMLIILLHESTKIWGLVLMFPFLRGDYHPGSECDQEVYKSVCDFAKVLSIFTIISYIFYILMYLLYLLATILICVVKRQREGPRETVSAETNDLMLSLNMET